MGDHLYDGLPTALKRAGNLDADTIIGDGATVRGFGDGLPAIPNTTGFC